MRTERYVPVATGRRDIGPATLFVAAAGCFAIGFLSLMALPRIWPNYVQTTTSDGPAQHPLEVGTAAPTPSPAGKPVPGVITEIKPGAAPETQRIPRYGR